MSFKEERIDNIRSIQMKKCIALLAIIGGLIGVMQIFQLGPWTFRPGLLWPYLSYIDDPRYNMGISCGTPYKCKLTINYGEKLSLTERIQEINASMLHFFKLTHLKANTTYYWKLNCSDGMISLPYINKIHEFRTAPDSGPFKICVMGDNRPDFFGISEFPQIMRRVVEESPNFIINVGDIVMSPTDYWQWDRFFYDIRNCATIGAAYMIGIGNHEWDEYTIIPDKGKTYKTYVNFPYKENYYAFNYSNVAFISIDTNEGEMTPSQLQDVEKWLDAANKSSKIDWVIVYGHHPMYDVDGRNSRVADKFEALFKKYNVDMYLAGHHHHYARLRVENLTYIISAGAGAELDINIQNESPFLIKSAIMFHYCKFEFNGKSLNVKIISHNGIIIDDFVLYSHKS